MQMIKRRLQLRKKKILIRLTILQMLNLPLMAAREILKNLKSVTLLSDEEDAVERNIYTKGVSSSNDVYYEVSGDGKS